MLVGAAQTAIDAERDRMIAREQQARPVTKAQEEIARLGGADKIVELGFPEGRLDYLSEEDKLQLLQGKMTVDQAVKWPNPFKLVLMCDQVRAATFTRKIRSPLRPDR